MKNNTILISGASIAGPALAFWLRRYGFTPTVIERAPAPREGGYKIDLRGAAIAVAERMGLLADIRCASTEMQDATFVSSMGKRLATMDAALFGGRTGDDVEIMRDDLARILYEATLPDTEYIFGDSITSLTQDEAGVHVTFERAAPRTFDLVIGADGLHSNVRTLTFGDESSFIHNLGYYIAIFTTANYLGLDRAELLYATPGKTLNLYSARQNTEAKALFLFASPPLAYDRHDSCQQQRFLANTFAKAGWECPRLLAAMHDAPDFYFDSISQVRMDDWSRGRVALLGDAGYCASPASGQGTSLALVGAYVLAGELAAACGDYRAAFTSYEEQMRPFIEQNQQLASSNIKGMVLQSRAQIWFQTRMVRLMPHLPGRDRMVERITRPIHEAANAITLKDFRVDGSLSQSQGMVAALPSPSPSLFA